MLTSTSSWSGSDCSGLSNLNLWKFEIQIIIKAIMSSYSSCWGQDYSTMTAPHINQIQSLSELKLASPFRFQLKTAVQFTLSAAIPSEMSCVSSYQPRPCYHPNHPQNILFSPRLPPLPHCHLKTHSSAVRTFLPASEQEAHEAQPKSLLRFHPFQSPVHD